MASEAYANDYETTLNAPGGTGVVRPVNLTFRTAIPATLAGGNFRIRVENEWLLVPTGGVAGLICTGCTTVEGSVAANHPDNAVVDQVLTRQGLLNSPGPMTAQGDLYTLDANLMPVRIPLGAAATVMTSDAGGTGVPKWAAAAGGGSSTPLVNPYTARMFRNAAYNSVAAVWTKIPFDTVDFDDSSMVTIGTSRFVAPVAGKYLITAGWRDTTANSTNFAIAVYVNGAQRNLGPLFGYAAALGGASVAGLVKLAVGDYVELFYFVQNVVAFDVGSVNTWAEIALIPGTPALPANTLAAKMYRSAAYNTVAATETKMPFDTVGFDPNGNLTIGTSQYTAPVSGKYLVDAQVYLNAVDRLLVRIRVNNVTKLTGDDLSGNGGIVSGILDLIAGDVVTVFYYTQNSDAIVTGQDPAVNRMEIAFLAGTGATIWVPQGPIVIPGFAGSPDIQAGGVNDDEFETTAGGLPIAGWTNGTQAPAAGDRNATAKSHLYLKSTAASDTLAHIYKAAPAIPYTVIAKLADHNVMFDTAVPHCGIFIADAAPPVKAVAIQLVGFTAAETSFTAGSYTSIGASPSTGGLNIATRKLRWSGGPAYFKIVVTALANISIYASYNGRVWYPIVVGYANAIGLANAGQVGLYVDNANNGPASLEALFDFIRFS